MKLLFLCLKSVKSTFNQLGVWSSKSIHFYHWISHNNQVVLHHTSTIYLSLANILWRQLPKLGKHVGFRYCNSILDTAATIREYCICIVGILFKINKSKRTQIFWYTLYQSMKYVCTHTYMQWKHSSSKYKYSSKVRLDRYRLICQVNF